jgi:tricorn protease
MRRSLPLRPVVPSLLALPLLALAALLAAPPAGAASDAAVPAEAQLTRLLRYPDIAGDKIAFSYGGDIWVVDANGGDARRLTADPGLELFPRFSPDGKQIAFMGEYNGTRQVYVIPTEGGTPRQLTFYNDVGDMPPRGGFDNEVIDWTPDGKEIVFIAHRQPWDVRRGGHWAVPAAGGMEHPFGPPEGSGGSFSPDGSRFAFTPMDRDFRTRKRYRGGQQQDVWVWTLATKVAEQVTSYPGPDNHPVWIGDRIYFASDREHATDLWAYDLATKKTTRAAHHEGWDVLWPSGDGHRIVYEAAGYVWRYDPAKNEDVRVPIRCVGDFGGTLPRIADVTKNIDAFDLSPSGARALFTARGDLFTAPAKEGEVRNLTRTPGVRERDAAWSPDGRSIAYWSDASGEYELYVRPADGSGEARRLTTDGASEPTWRYGAQWSPDSRWLAFADRKARLRVVAAAGGPIVEVDRSTVSDLNDFSWSPDSRWLAYTKAGAVTQLGSIWVWSREQGKASQLTSDETSESNPVWDPQGRYLYFLSDRDFNLTFSGYEFDFLYTQPTKPYVAMLSASGPGLFLPKSDEEKPAPLPGTTVADASPPKGKGDGKTGDARAAGGGGADAAPPRKGVHVDIDVTGFERRVRALPVGKGDYRSLAATDAGVLYVKSSGASGGPGTLTLFDLEAKKEQPILPGVRGYVLSADRKKILWQKPGDGDYGIVDVHPVPEGDAGKLDLAGMQSTVDPRAEWHQELVEAWRLYRDFFYDPNMHGQDWTAIRAKYEPLVAHMAHRTDLDFVLGEMAGELQSGHCYVESSGDWQVPRHEGGLLGAVIVADPSGYFRVAHVFPGENWHEDTRSPLTEPGVHVSEGDLVLAVDGVSTRGVDNFYRLLANKGDRVVTLRIAAGEGKPAREERVRTITRETSLRYLEWVAQRRQMVDKLSGGRIGYIHLPNTAVEGNRELFKGFYAQSTKDALVLDDRYNGGGFIPFQMIQLLQRPLLSYWARRDLAPLLTPQYYHRGPKAVLTNGYAGSGGDAFPYFFRERHLGTLIGTTTWGGLIGLSGNPSFMDGGGVEVPEFRFIDPDTQQFAVEGEGVKPDIEVVDRPDLVAQGHDPSLEKAVQVLLDELRKSPPQPLRVPKPPAPEAKANWRMEPQ